MFYRTNLDFTPLDSKTHVSTNFVKIGCDALQSDVSFVRIIWVDASGQHRCRVSHLFYIFSSAAVNVMPTI